MASGVNAQDIVCCSLCNQITKLAFCNSCRSLYCEPCFEIHMQSCSVDCCQKNQDRESTEKKFYGSSTTDERKVTIPCPNHRHISCKSFCNLCSKGLCFKCEDDHRKHDVVGIFKAYIQKKRDIIQERKILQKTVKIVLLQNLKQLTEEIQRIATTYEETENQISKTVSDWINEIKIVKAELTQRLTNVRIKHLDLLKQQQTQMENMLKRIQKEDEKYERSLESPLSVMAKEINVSVRIIPEGKEFIPPKFDVGTWFDKNKTIKSLVPANEILFPNSSWIQPLIGELREVEPKAIPSKEINPRFQSAEGPEVKFVLHFEVNKLSDIKCQIQDSETVWICGEGDNAIKYDTIESSTLRALVTSGDASPRYLGLIENEVLLSDHNNHAVMKTTAGETSTNFTSTGDWEPRGIACSLSKEVFLCLYNGNVEHGKVQKYDYKGCCLKEYEFNQEDKIPLYENPTYVALNMNGDICTSDPGKSAVVVINKSGSCRFSYQGNVEPNIIKSLIKRKFTKFNPQGIATDSWGQILVADQASNSVHIINEWGNFVQYLFVHEGDCPSGISIDRRDILWICEKKRKNSCPVKVINYINLY